MEFSDTLLDYFNKILFPDEGEFLLQALKWLFNLSNEKKLRLIPFLHGFFEGSLYSLLEEGYAARRQKGTQRSPTKE